MRLFPTTLLLLSAISLMAAPCCLCSDWVEDGGNATAKKEHQIKAEPPESKEPATTASANQSKQTATGKTVLQGSATTHTLLETPLLPHVQAKAQALRAAEIARVDAEADGFLARAEINQITPPSVFRAFLASTHPGFLKSDKNVAKSLVVVRGQWDESTRPLQSLGLKFTTIKTKHLTELPIDSVKVLIIDCAGEVSRKDLQKIRDFVGRGGYLISTDWTLNNTLAKAFPGYIQWSGENTDGIVTDALALNADEALFRGITGRRYTWKLDRMSQQVRVINPAKVRVLARSSKLAAIDVQRRVLTNPLLAGVLACEFNFGRGKVLHLVGHFDNCANTFKPNLLPDPAPDLGISFRQALTANFIVEGLGQTQPSAAEMPPEQ